jgi:hypothetical protein
MELADTTVHDARTANNADADKLNAFQRELQDRSFDVGGSDDDHEEDDEDDDHPAVNNNDGGVHPLIAELREIGMFHFIEKYVPLPILGPGAAISSANPTALPWSTLLKAFGITLVRLPFSSCLGFK